MASMLTTQQVAERWNCSERHVQELAAARELRGLKLGRPWRFSLADVEAFESRNTPQPQSVPAHAARVAMSEGVYEPIFEGPVPWRPEVIESAARPAAHRAVNSKRAASATN